MAKIADRYYIDHPWMIVEEGFNPEYALVSESVFSLGNEHMGVRGYFDEGYGNSTLQGSYMSGVYEEAPGAQSGYKGMVDKTYFMVNTVDWLAFKPEIDGETLDLATSKFTDFKRVLDLRTGLLTRSFVWVTRSGKELRLTFERFLSMQSVRYGGQRVTMQPLNFSGSITVYAGLDFSRPHVTAGRNLWNVFESSCKDSVCSMLAQTQTSGKTVFATCSFTGDIASCTPQPFEDKKAAVELTVPLTQGKESVVTRLYESLAFPGAVGETEQAECAAAGEALLTADYDSLLRLSAAWWEAAWRRSDIEIQGDDLNQQGIRFCIFQMHQTYHGAEESSVIGAKGLTGEAYNGNTFWDTETYCLPFYLFDNPEAARTLLVFRYNTLDSARRRAKALDCEGAFYPIATISGEECCTLWQHASLQLQPSTAVAYGIWHYVKLTNDTAFLYRYGAEMLAEICRMLVTRGDFSSSGLYGYYGVMGPDEFQMMVNNNCYTNYMGKVTLEYALEVFEQMKKDAPAQYGELAKAIHLREEEFARWKTIAGKMFIPYDDTTKLFEQHEGFYNLPHIEVDSIPIEDFPLYHHWTYDRIYRNDMIKQPDVLMMLLLYSARFTQEQKLKNYEFYEPKCIHESSLSPSVHSILACELGKYQEAYDFFGFATRMDLDNYNRNSGEGLHTTSIAAAWMNIVYGFGGLRSDGEIISLSPTIPEAWQSYTFRFLTGGEVVVVRIDKTHLHLATVSGKEVALLVYGEKTTVGPELSIRLHND